MTLAYDDMENQSDRMIHVREEKRSEFRKRRGRIISGVEILMVVWKNTECAF